MFWYMQSKRHPTFGPYLIGLLSEMTNIINFNKLLRTVYFLTVLLRRRLVRYPGNFDLLYRESPNVCSALEPYFSVGRTLVDTEFVRDRDAFCFAALNEVAAVNILANIYVICLFCFGMFCMRSAAIQTVLEQFLRLKWNWNATTHNQICLMSYFHSRLHSFQLHVTSCYINVPVLYEVWNAITPFAYECEMTDDGFNNVSCLCVIVTADRRRQLGVGCGVYVTGCVY